LEKYHPICIHQSVPAVFHSLPHQGKNQYSEVESQFATQPKKLSTSGRLAKQYNVSRDTIFRDSKLAEGLTSIGNASPEAKRKILSGEIAINRNKLELLSSASNEEIEAVAAQIEDGSYMRRAPRAPISDAVLPEIRQLNVIIKDFASSFNSMFQELNNGGTVQLKSVIRSYIDQLEDLYRNIK